LLPHIAGEKALNDAQYSDTFLSEPRVAAEDLGRPMSGRGRKGGFGEAATPFEQEKDPLIKRETLELVRAYYKIREARVRKRIFEMVKAVGAASHAEVLGSRKGGKTRHASS
jgi:hypothetical protein